MRVVNLRNKLDEETIYSDSAELFKIGLSIFRYLIKYEWLITQTLVYLNHYKFMLCEYYLNKNIIISFLI